MRWPWSSESHDAPKLASKEPSVPPASYSSSSAEDASPSSGSDDGSWNSPILPNSWSYYFSAQIIVPSLIMTSALLAGRHLYVMYLRRIPGAATIAPSFWRKRSLLGTVTSVGDGDGFRLFHTPGGRLAGWGWWRKIPPRSKLKDQTISIRLAGVDAPETAHFGHPAQPGSAEALSFLTGYLLHRRVRAKIHRRDQYERAVATAYTWRTPRFLPFLPLRRDVSLELLRHGLATVYEGQGVEFGGREKQYRRMEAWAKGKKRGIWGKAAQKGWESPRDFKTRTKAEDASGKTGEG